MENNRLITKARQCGTPVFTQIKFLKSMEGKTNSAKGKLMIRSMMIQFLNRVGWLDITDFLELDRKGILPDNLRQCVDAYKEAVKFQAQHLSDYIDNKLFEDIMKGEK